MLPTLTGAGNKPNPPDCELKGIERGVKVGEVADALVSAGGIVMESNDQITPDFAAAISQRRIEPAIPIIIQFSDNTVLNRIIILQVEFY